MLSGPKGRLSHINSVLQRTFFSEEVAFSPMEGTATVQ